jgi:thiol-disulfide isomerase/thioredoxin
MSTETSPPNSTLFGKILVLAVAAAVLLLIAIKGGNRPSGNAMEHPLVGRYYRMLHVVPLVGDGAVTTGIEGLGGNVTVIDFWATWCPPCVNEFPGLLALAAKYKDRPDFRFISVEHDAGVAGDRISDAQENVKAFLKRRGANIPVYFDPNHQSYENLSTLGGIPGGVLPTTLVVDRTGIIRACWEGSGPGKLEELEEVVAKVLEEQSPPDKKEPDAAPGSPAP